jgi:hypothetical protein
VINWIPGVPPLNELREGELILVVVMYDLGHVGDPFVAEYAEGALHDTFEKEPFFEGNVIKWARINTEPFEYDQEKLRAFFDKENGAEPEPPELSDAHKELFSRLIFSMTKSAARLSFIDFLSELNISEKDYQVIRDYLSVKYGVKTYV